MICSDYIYTRDTKGKLRFWGYEVDGGRWRGVSGLVDGALVESGWTTCTPKSQDTAEEQAIFEAKAEETKKLERKYRRDKDAEFDDLFIQPMLAQDYDKLKKPLIFPVAAQPKLDGMRAVITALGATTRQGKDIPTIPHVLEDLAPVFEKYPDLVLDGEIYNHAFKDDFDSLMSLARKSKDLTDEEKAEARRTLQYHIYDIADSSAGPFTERFAMLETIFLDEFPVVPSDNQHLHYVDLVETFVVDDSKRLDELLETFLTLGYEGEMVRLLDSDYEHKRSKGLLKRKDFETKEFKLKRIEEGNGNWAGLAKRVVVELEDGRENEGGIRGNMAKAKELLDNKEHYEKGWVTMRFMKQRTPDGKLRAPVAIDFHPNGRQD